MHHVDAVEIHVGHVGRWVNAPHWIPNVYGPRLFMVRLGAIAIIPKI